ncbi:hypothetical protein TMatcc_007340 [Talaromyces marneffei ATCC 18224]|uniref:Tetraspanin Tsp3 n=2 Tax=Talaromyces marneffei TaxID=37727 RepID=B6QFM4_TALMQ|nr:conserved hypothetical protein [Talaromyces marneffei ATCC 18224]KAE8553228.1 hypothetical protein EYB25_004610 [Talaromyces marneffei]
MPPAYSAISTSVVIILLLLSTVVSIALGCIAWSRINSLFLPFPTSLGAISTFYPLLPFLSALIANVLASRYQRDRGDLPKNRITGSTTSDENGSHTTATTSVTAVNGTLPPSRSLQILFSSAVSSVVNFVIDQSLTLLPVVIATLSATYVSPSDNNCHLEQAWQSYYHNKDVNSIRTIQDQLQCCGLRSTRDRAWPFKDANHGANACESTTGYTQSCLQPWSEQERRVAVLVFVVAVLGWGIKMGTTNFTSGRFYAFANSRTRRNAWFDEANSRTERHGESSGPRLLPYTDTVFETAESTEEAADVHGQDTSIGESPLLNPDARDLSCPDGRELTGGSPWGGNV